MKKFILISIILLSNMTYFHGMNAEETGLPIEELISHIGKTDYQLKSTAILNMKKNIRYNSIYINRYTETNIYVQKICFIRVISELADEVSYPYLLKYLSDTDRTILIETISALGKTRTHPYDQILINTAKKHKDDEHITIAVIHALGEFTDDDIAYFIGKYLHDQRLNIRIAAIEGLGAMGTDKAADLLIETFYTNPNGNEKEIIHALGESRNSLNAQEVIWQIFEDRESPFFLDALISLGELESYRHTGLLVELLDHQSRSIRKAAIYALSRIGSLSAVNPLIEFLNNPASYDLRNLITHAIEEICSVYSFEEILATVKETDHPAIVAIQLGKLSDPSSVEVLKELMRNDDPINRITAIEALSYFDMPEVDNAIADRLTESSPLEFFYQIRYFINGRSNASHSIKLIMTKKHYTDYKLAIYLGFLNHYEAQDNIFNILQNPTNPYRWVAVASMENWGYNRPIAHRLKKILQKESFAMRYHAAKVLKRFSNEEPSLKQFLQKCYYREQQPRIKALLK